MQLCSFSFYCEVQTQTTDIPPEPGSIGKRKALFSMFQVLSFWTSLPLPDRNRQSSLSGIWKGKGYSDAQGWRDTGMRQGSSSGTGGSPKMGIMRAEPWGGLGRYCQVYRGRDGTGIEVDGRTSRNRPAEGARGPTKRTGEAALRCAKAGMGVWQRVRQVPGGTA